MSFNGAQNLQNNILRKQEKGAWEKFFAYRPVKVHNKWTWMKTVYRRRTHNYVDMDNWTYWEYGDLFDIVKQ